MMRRKTSLKKRSRILKFLLVATLIKKRHLLLHLELEEMRLQLQARVSQIPKPFRFLMLVSVWVLALILPRTLLKSYSWMTILTQSMLLLSGARTFLIISESSFNSNSVSTLSVWQLCLLEELLLGTHHSAWYNCCGRTLSWTFWQP